MGTYKVYYTKFREKVQQVFPLFPEKARKNPPRKNKEKNCVHFRENVV